MNNDPSDITGFNTYVKLPTDFHLTKYGIEVRLVQESDAPFIISLRTDERLSRYLNPTDNDEEKQKVWIRNYKLREAEGKEFYFIFSKSGKPFGLNRIYNVEDQTCTTGSWICKIGTPVEVAIPTVIITRDIMFDILGFKKDYFEVRKDNIKVLRFHQILESVKIGETEVDILFKVTPESHSKGKNKILKLLNIEE